MGGTLVRQKIHELIIEKALISNADTETCLSPASYEIRVGGYFDWEAGTKREIEEGSVIAVAPGGFAIMSSVEQVALPNNIIGMMYLRSTYARRGFLPWFQGIVDPGYQGGLSIVLHNRLSSAVKIEARERICHLVFEELEQPVEEGYRGHYQHSTGAQPAADIHPKPVVKTIGQPSVADTSKSSGTLLALLEQLAATDPETVSNLLKRLMY